MDKENFVIDQFKNNINGDDGAVINNLVFSKDLFSQNSHFLSSWLSPFEIGAKAMMVNLSDAIVMNAMPKYALLGLSIPKNFSNKKILELSKGIKFACDKFGVKVIGGDTISSEILNLSITIISNTKRPIFRNRSKVGDFVAFSGDVGGVLKDFKRLRNLGQVSKNSRFKKVVLRDKFFYKSARFIRSAMDISDGLASDLKKFSKLDYKFIKKLNYFELNSAEEYEILLSCDKKYKKRLENEAKKARIKLTFFATIKKGRYKSNARSWHF